VSPDLVLLGNLLVDDVVFPDGRTRLGAPGGALLYGALGARLWGVSVGIVTWHGDDYPAEALDALASRGVALEGAHALGRPGLRTWLLYEGARRRVVHRLEGPSHAEVSPGPGEIPRGWRRARAFHLAPMPPETQAELVAELSRVPGALLSLDPYVLLGAEAVERWRDVLRSVDVLLMSEDEMELPGWRHDPPAALRALAGGRLELVMLKRGAAGGIGYDARHGRLAPWPARGRCVDPTGAGDAFAAGFLAGLLRGEGLERSVFRGVVGASFAIEAWGPDGLLAATPETAEARLAEWFGGTG
jgi:sugar/nucleoside kinase (ribokinase family)